LVRLAFTEVKYKYRLNNDNETLIVDNPTRNSPPLQGTESVILFFLERHTETYKHNLHCIYLFDEQKT